MTDHTPSSANQDLSVLLELAPRAADLATRLVAAGPKAAHVSASETHEIAEFVHTAIAALRGSIACSPAADESFVALFPNDGLSSAQFHELWERAGKYLNPNNSARENLPRQVGKFAAFVAREARGDGMAPERIIQAIRAAGFRDHPTDITRKCVNAIVNEVTPLLKPKQYTALARESTSRPPAAPNLSARQYHILKTDPDQFQAVVSGAKTFEIRLNDRGYAVGDVLVLRETRHSGVEMRAGAPLQYTGHECQRLISHVLTGYGLADGWCCLSFELPNVVGASALVADARAALAQLEAACDTLCRLRTQEQYHSMVDSGQQDALLALDDARAQARAALASAPLDGEVVAYRVLRNAGGGTWEADGRHWGDGAPSRELLEDLAKRSDGWRIEYAYAATQASEADSQWRDLALKFDAQRMVFRDLLKVVAGKLAAVSGARDEEANRMLDMARDALSTSPGECLKAQASEAVRTVHTACDSEVMREAAWHACRKDVGTGGWTAAEAFHYRGFFMHGWRAAMSAQPRMQKKESGDGDQ